MSSNVSPDGRVLIFASLKGFGDAPEAPALDYAALRERMDGVRNGYSNLYRLQLQDL